MSEETNSTPEVIERLPKPDKKAHDAEITKLDNEIKKLQARSDVLRKEMDALKEGRGGYGEQIQAAKAEYATLRAEKEAKIQARNEATARLRKAQDDKDASIKSQKSQRAGLRFRTAEEYDDEIKQLRLQQETRSMSLSEEKRLIKEIETLQMQREAVSKLSGNDDVVGKHQDTIKVLKQEKEEKNKAIDAVQEKMNEKKKALDELYKLNDEEKKQDKFPELAKERKELKTQLDEKFNAIREQRKAFKEANDKYYENVRAVRKKKEEERKKQEEELKKEYEEKLAEYEKEMAKIHPYQDEMDLCDALIKYLESNYVKDAGKNVEKKEEAPVELDGMKPLQRKTEDFMNFGGGKKKKGKKTKKENGKLSLPMAQLDAFSSIGLLPPTTVGAVADTVQAIKDKKEWFDKQTTRADGKKLDEAESKSEKPKKSNKKFASNEEAFPTLGGADSSVPSGPTSWGPGVAPIASEVMPTEPEEE